MLSVYLKCRSSIRSFLRNNSVQSLQDKTKTGITMFQKNLKNLRL